MANNSKPKLSGDYIFNTSQLDQSNTENWKADWLQSDFNSDHWKLKSYAINTKNKHFTIYWDYIISFKNKTNLLDPDFINHLNTIKKIVFLSRSSTEYFGINKSTNIHLTRSSQQISLANSLKQITRWLAHNNYEVDLYGFNILNKSHLYQFSHDMKYGKQIGDGTYDYLNDFLRQQSDSKNISEYLNSGKINYIKLSKHHNLSSKNCKFRATPALKSALSKYEITSFTNKRSNSYSRKSTELEPTRNSKFSSSNIRPLSISAIAGYMRGFKAIGYFSSLLPELKNLEWCEDFNIADISKLFGFEEKSKTPVIPINTALEYLDHSIRWVEIYGKHIIRLKKSSDIKLLDLMKGKTSRKDHFAKQVFNQLIHEAASKETLESLSKNGLDIRRYNRNPSNFSNVEIRNNLSIEEAAECLVSACFILIGTFSCRRISEIMDLTQNCCRPSFDGGWDITFGLRKASPVEELSQIGRPVPDIVNKAVHLLQDLFPINSYGIESRHGLNPLFLNSYTVKNKRVPIDYRCQTTMYRSLELFSDVIQITPNDKNQRWYLRSHELRRFFAISYFWQDRFSSLPALSWFMGHTDTEQTLHYVTEEIVASEIPEEEARFSASIILEEKASTIEGIEKLEKLAMEHFQTKNLKFIPQQELESYLETLFKNGCKIIKHKLKNKVIFIEEL